MHRYVLACFAAAFATIPSPGFASGSESAARTGPVITPTFYSSSQSRTAPGQNHLVLAEEPYNQGKALFSGKYNFGKPKLTLLNIEEKKQRLAALRKSLPAPEQENLNPPELARRLTNREMNSLEYYLRMRFKKFLSNSPTWANQEPPPKVATSR